MYICMPKHIPNIYAIIEFPVVYPHHPLMKTHGSYGLSGTAHDTVDTFAQ